jgi:hypothetical protein
MATCDKEQETSSWPLRIQAARNPSNEGALIGELTTSLFFFERQSVEGNSESLKSKKVEGKSLADSRARSSPEQDWGLLLC